MDCRSPQFFEVAIWEHSPSTGTYNWYTAQSYCNNLSTGGRKGWRLPTVQELASLVDPTQTDPALPEGHPFSNVQSSYYWSSATCADVPDGAWDVYFNNGNVANYAKSTATSTTFGACAADRVLTLSDLVLW